MNTRDNPLSSWMRTCAVVMGALGLYVLFSGGLTWWRMALAVLLLACPVTMLWLAWKYGREGQDFTDDHKEIHHGS